MDKSRRNTRRRSTMMKDFAQFLSNETKSTFLMGEQDEKKEFPLKEKKIRSRRKRRRSTVKDFGQILTGKRINKFVS